MMTFVFIRLFFLILSGIMGYYIGDMVDQHVLGAQIGVVGGIVLIFIEQCLHRVSVRGLSSTVFGLLMGLFMAKLVSYVLELLPMEPFTQSIASLVVILVFSYLGAVMALRGKDEFNVIIPYVRFKRQDMHSSLVLLDTSAIIDGRITDVYKTHFIFGRLIVPRFVLKELQILADSSDDIKRQRGRRGLEILQNMQKDSAVDVRIHEADIAAEGNVDERIIRLAKFLDAAVCTTDYNLEKVGLLQGVIVLNLNALADSLRSIIFPGEQLGIQLVKTGKEPGQAVGYLPDGTMIVVSGAQNKIGEFVNVLVVSILQTHSGKMIFAELEGSKA